MTIIGGILFALACLFGVLPIVCAGLDKEK